MKLIRRCITMMLVLTILSSINVTALAKNDKDIVKENPVVEGIAPNDGIEADEGGNLSKKELTKKQQKEEQEVSIKAGSVKVYKYVNITGRYDGYHDRGVVMTGTNKKNSTDSMTFTYTREVSNSASIATGFSKASNSASIATGFSKASVEAVVGYNVSWSATKSWSYTASVGPYKTVNIGYKDWYHVQKLKFTTVIEAYEGNSIYPKTTYQYATGQAKQWFKPEFYSY